MKKSSLFLAAIGLFIMGYGLSGWQNTKDASVIHFINRELIKLNKSSQAEAHDVRAVNTQEKTEVESNSKFSVRYAFYRDCLESSKPCEGFSNQNGDIYLSEVRSEMLHEMAALFQEVKANPNLLTQEHQKTAQIMLTDATPDIQIIGFQILELFPISEINLDLVSHATEDAFDAGVVNAGLHELERYKNNPEYNRQITSALIQQIGLGVNDQAVNEAIEKLPIFLNSENKAKFNDLLMQLAEVSRKNSGLQRRFKALQSVLK